MTSNLVRAVLLFSFLALLSCQNGVEDKNAANHSASFEVINIQPNSAMDTFSSNPGWPELKDTAKISLKACIQDRYYQLPIVGDKFDIKTELGSYSAQSAGDGCIVWAEEFKFDYTSDETFYKISGEIINEHNYLGRFNYDLGVNPWTGEIRFLNRDDEPVKMVNINDLKASSLEQKFRIKNFSVTPTDYLFRDDSAELKLNFLASPVINRKLLDNTIRNNELFTGGEFELEFNLFQRTKGTQLRELIASTTTTAQINSNGQIEEQIEFDINKLIDYRNEMELTVSAIANGVELDLGIDSGYMLLRGISNPTSGEYLLSLPSEIAAMKAQSGQYRAFKAQKVRKDPNEVKKHGIIIDDVSGSLPGLEVDGNMDVFSMKNSILASFRLSVIDTLFFNGVNGNFQVEVKDLVSGEVYYPVDGPEVSTKLRKNAGELIFDIKISFDEDYEFDYRRHRISITGLGDEFEGITATRDVDINPRVRNANYIRDAQDLTKPTISANGDNNNSPQIYFEMAEFNFKRNEEDLENGILYQVNKDLDLLNERVVEFKLTPRQRLKHNYNGRKDGWPIIKTGAVNISFMLFTPKYKNTQSYNRTIDLNDFDLLTADKVENVPIMDGLIEAEVNLAHLFEARKVMSFKNIGVLYVESANKNSKIKPGYIVGPIEIFKSTGFLKPYRDSRLPSAKEAELAQTNEQIIKKTADFIDSRPDMLLKDEEISDPYKEFKEVITDFRTQKEVKVFDPVAPGRKSAKTVHHVYDTIKEFKQNKNSEVSDKTLKKAMASTLVLEPEEIREFCSLFYDPEQERTYGMNSRGVFATHTLKGEMYKKCKKDPVAYIGFHEMNFINRITKQPAQLKLETGKATAIENTKSLMRNEAHFMTKGEMFQEMNGMRTSAAFMAGLHLYLSVTGVEGGMRSEKFDMIQTSELLSQQRRIINQDGQNFLVTTVDVLFEAEYKKCVMVAPKWVSIDKPRDYIDYDREFWKGIYSIFRETEDTSIKVTSDKRHIICKKRLEKRNLNESWFFVRLAAKTKKEDIDQSMAKNTVADIFRGQKAYERYRITDLENDKSRILAVREDTDEEITKRYQNYMKKNGRHLKYNERLGVAFRGLYEPIADDKDRRELKELLGIDVKNSIED